MEIDYRKMMAQVDYIKHISWDDYKKYQELRNKRYQSRSPIMRMFITDDMIDEMWDLELDDWCKNTIVPFPPVNITKEMIRQHNIFCMMLGKLLINKLIPEPIITMEYQPFIK